MGVNRGEGCARRNVLGIFARIKALMRWIRKHVKSGGC